LTTFFAQAQDATGSSLPRYVKDEVALLIQTPAPTDQALQLLLRSIITCIMKRLVRQVVLVQEQDQWYVTDGIADDTDTSALRPLQQCSIVYRIAFGPRAGRAKIKDPVARWHRASRDVAVGVHAKACGAGAKATIALDSISRGSVAKSHRMRSGAQRSCRRRQTSLSH
jgi:hypothetical protein